MITCTSIWAVGYTGVYVGHLPAGDEGDPDPLGASTKIQSKMRQCNFYIVQSHFETMYIC